jgi:putative transposase
MHQVMNRLKFKLALDKTFIGPIRKGFNFLGYRFSHQGHLSGIDICCMFNKIISGLSLPKYLSSDNDPLFTFHRWQANLRIMDIEEIKTVPYTPISHPFVERVIGTVRRELLD